MHQEIIKARNHIIRPVYSFDYKYRIVFIKPDECGLILDSLSLLRREKDIDSETYHEIREYYYAYYKNYKKIVELNYNEPRRIAQKFISKKKVRSFIFNRDNNSCLCCGSKNKLEIDHIIPVSRGGENKLSNLQTLCKKCNVIKSDNFKDYRNGAR